MKSKAKEAMHGKTNPEILTAPLDWSTGADPEGVTGATGVLPPGAEPVGTCEAEV